jgi:hypothetical protein
VNNDDFDKKFSLAKTLTKIRNTLWTNYWNSLLCEITCKICQYLY